MLSPLIQELLSVRKDTFLLIYGEKILCSCGKFLESSEVAENHIVQFHERSTNDLILSPLDVIVSKFLSFTKQCVLPSPSASLKSFPLPSESPFSICPDDEFFPTALSDLKCEECDDADAQSFAQLREHYIGFHAKWLPPESNRFSRTPKKINGTRFFCPLPSCKCHLSKGDKYFGTWKLLKQHYRKVHAARNTICSQCEKSFPTELDLRQHVRISCGKEFKCPDCGAKYSRLENLQTHCRRKAHALDSHLDQNSLQSKPSTKRDPLSLGHINAAIALSQLSCPIVKKEKPKADIAVQTSTKRKSEHRDLKKMKSRKLAPKIPPKPLCPPPPIPDLISTSCANTQTLDDDLFIQELFSSSETQTCWDKEDLDVLLSSTAEGATKKETPKIGEIEQFSTETQTDSFEKWKHTETQFNVYDTLNYFDGEDFLRSIETQTNDERVFSSSETQT